MKYTEWLIKVKGIDLNMYVNMPFDVRVELHREYEEYFNQLKVGD